MDTTIDSGIWDYSDSTVEQGGYETLTLNPLGEDPLGEIGPVGQNTLRMYGELGRGGMAIVREARQRSIARQVAVKMAHAPEEEMSGEILRREAYVLGLLDHPNILPIYTFTEEEGQSALVLKKIVGRKWSDYLRSPGLVEVAFGVDDVLEWHLQILLKVSDAIRFAHSRGIIHRDLKPSNVMIGDFGEVYLMDWGLAVSTKKSHERVLPLVRDLFDISGTPAYMAPEMLRPEALGISYQTDVYLLGATLYQILCGHPPHIADTEAETYEKIDRSCPVFPGDVSTALRSICERAMHKTARKRYASVEELKAAVKAYLQHRGTRQLLRRAHELLARLRCEVQDRSDRYFLHSISGPCKFAFQEVLRSLPDSEQAKMGLQECTDLMVDYELLCDEPAAAASLLAELGVQEGERYQRVVRALWDRESKEVESAKLRRDVDHGFRRSGRRTAMTWVGLGWCVTLLCVHVVMPETSYRLQGLSHFSFLGLWLGVGWVGKEWVTSTTINRCLYKTVLLATVFAIVFNMGAFMMGLPAEQAQVYHLFVFFCASMITVSMVDWRAWPTALAFLAAFVLSGRYPEYTLLAMAAANAVLVANILWMWASPRESKEPRGQ